MKPDFARNLRCPACRCEKTLELHERETDELEVREGTLRCGACGGEFPVHRGVAELLHDPPEHILIEAAGLERFAEHMRQGGWDRETMLSLPDLEHGYWYVQARSMHQLLTTIPFVPGQSVLDVGSNTCWASAHFAERGLRAIALDIATVELQGLYTADYYIEERDLFFERLLGSMDAIPLESSSVDYVYCCQVLHHNDLAGLRRTFGEIFRVLRPGGRLLMVNETLKTLRDPSGVHVDGVEEFEGYEHAHWAQRYRWEATRAGFMTEVSEPHYVAFFGDAAPELELGAGPVAALRDRMEGALRSSGIARRAYLSWLNNVRGQVSMNMIATKPLYYVGRHEGMATGERLLRLAGQYARLPVDRRRGRALARLPRSPEQIAAVARRASSVEHSGTG